jgi:hypothetical protein
MSEHCAICGCQLYRGPDTYAKPTIEGRSGATRHHFVAERFFGRSGNRPGIQIEGIFTHALPFGEEGESGVFCYECHEILLHNPVLLREDIECFAKLVQMRNLAEEVKPAHYSKIAGRIELFHEVIARGLKLLHEEVTERREPG